jgi:hypothetical protein
MGSHDAPALANLYLAWREWQAMDQLQAAARDPTIANSIRMDCAAAADAFSNTDRYMDDVLFVDNPCLDRYLYLKPPGTARGLDVGFYDPDRVKLNETTLPAEDGAVSHVHYLDLDITAKSDGRVLVDIWDKRRELPFHVIRFPDVRTVLSSTCRFNILTTLGIAYVRRVRSTATWLSRVAEQARYMIDDKHYCDKRVQQSAKRVTARVASVLRTRRARPGNNRLGRSRELYGMLQRRIRDMD